MKEIYKNLSKSMAHALRHAPEQYGLKLDNNGWISILDLIEGLKSKSRKWQNLDRDLIEVMIEDADKQRYQILDNRIRAVYGHSSEDIEITYEPSEPPEILFHGTTPKALDLIKPDGLKKMNRKFVHLSPDIDTAMIVAKRRTNKPCIIRVNAQDAFLNGIQFYYGHDQIWLSEDIPAIFLQIKTP